MKNEVENPLPLEPVQTGKLMFQFDNDTPIEAGNIFDYGKAVIEIHQNKIPDNEELKQNSLVEFKSEEGKTFRLYMQNV